MGRALDKRGLSIFLIVLLVGLPQISETIYTPALPNIVDALQTTSTLVQWTLSVYFFGFAVGTLFWGSLSDRWGRYPCMLWGLILYVVFSVLCALSTNIGLLLLFRIGQAFGVSTGSVITLTMIRESFPMKKVHHIFTYIGLALSTVPVLGPVIGGYIIQFFMWHANFYLLAILGCFTFLCSYFRLPETKPTSVRWVSGKELLSLIKRMLMDPHFLGAAWVIAAFNGILFSFYAEAPFIFIDLLKFEPKNYGKLGLAIAVASFLGTLLSRRFMHRYSIKKLVYIGMMIAVIGASCMVLSSIPFIFHISAFLSTALLIISFSGLMFGFVGFVVPAIFSIALKDYVGYLGTAGAVLGTLYYSVLVVLISIMGVIHNGTAWPMPVYFLVLLVSVALTFKKHVSLSNETY